VKINKILGNFHKILLKFTKIRMDFQLTKFFGEFYMIFFLSVGFKWSRTVFWVYCVRDTWIHRTKSLISTLFLLLSVLQSISVTWLDFYVYVRCLEHCYLRWASWNFFSNKMHFFFLPYSMSAEWVWKFTKPLLLKIWSSVLYNFGFFIFLGRFYKNNISMLGLS
jgi:hypothetical protein